MNGFIPMVLTISLLSTSGCGFFQRKTLPPEQPSTQLCSFQVFDRQVLQKGGQVAVEPFLAGEHVRACEELDKLALKIIQGMAQTTQTPHDRVPFKIVGADHVQDADFVIRGHFTKMSVPRGMKKWMFRKPCLLAVEGEIIDVRTGEPVARFDHERQTRQRPGHFDSGGCPGHARGIRSSTCPGHVATGHAPGRWRPAGASLDDLANSIGIDLGTFLLTLGAKT